MAADKVNHAGETERRSSRLRSLEHAPRLLTDRQLRHVDHLRQLAAEAGVRRYRCWLVHRFWTPRKHDGTKSDVLIEIVPTPIVRGGPGLVLHGEGLTEEGTLQVRVSSHYLEDDLMGRTPDLALEADPTRRIDESDREFFWLVQEHGRTSPRAPVRRYHPVGIPQRKAFSCEVQLVQQDLGPGRGFEDLSHVVGA